MTKSVLMTLCLQVVLFGCPPDGARDVPVLHRREERRSQRLVVRGTGGVVVVVVPASWPSHAQPGLEPPHRDFLPAGTRVSRGGAPAGEEAMRSLRDHQLRVGPKVGGLRLPGGWVALQLRRRC